MLNNKKIKTEHSTLLQETLKQILFQVCGAAAGRLAVR